MSFLQPPLKTSNKIEQEESRATVCRSRFKVAFFADIYVEHILNQMWAATLFGAFALIVSISTRKAQQSNRAKL